MSWYTVDILLVICYILFWTELCSYYVASVNAVTSDLYWVVGDSRYEETCYENVLMLTIREVWMLLRSYKPSGGN